MKDQIKQLYKSGYNINTIAKKLGTAHHKVSWIVQQMQMSGELVDFYDLPNSIVHMMPCQILKQSDLGR